MSCQQFMRPVPAALSLFSEPALIPGEKLHEYEALRDLLIEDIDQQSNLEWLWLLDVVELTWEVIRYRRLKARVTSMCRAKAIEAMLLRLDAPAAEPSPLRLLQTKRSVDAWQCDPQAAVEIEGRLNRAGYDDLAINAEVFVQAKDAITLFDALTHAAQARRNSLLREIGLSRAFGMRVSRMEWKEIEGNLDVRRGRPGAAAYPSVPPQSRTSRSVERSMLADISDSEGLE